MSTVNRISLNEAGYNEFKDTFKRAARAYQKRIGRTRYFINIYEYEWADFRDDKANSFSVDVQFEGQDDIYINIEFSIPDNWSIEQVEAKVEKLFTTLDSKDYE